MVIEEQRDNGHAQRHERKRQAIRKHGLEAIPAQEREQQKQDAHHRQSEYRAAAEHDERIDHPFAGKRVEYAA